MQVPVSTATAVMSERRRPTRHQSAWRVVHTDINQSRVKSGPEAV